MSKSARIEKIARSIIDKERRIAQLFEEAHIRFPEASAIYDELDKYRADLEEARKYLKETLHQENDYDIHQIEDVQFSITKVVRMKVEDIDEVPAEFKQVMEVADEKRAANYYKLYGEPPKGFSDNSYDKINWKRKDAKES